MYRSIYLSCYVTHLVAVGWRCSDAICEFLTPCCCFLSAERQTAGIFILCVTCSYALSSAAPCRTITFCAPGTPCAVGKHHDGNPRRHQDTVRAFVPTILLRVLVNVYELISKTSTHWQWFREWFRHQRKRCTVKEPLRGPRSDLVDTVYDVRVEGIMPRRGCLGLN